MTVDLCIFWVMFATYDFELSDFYMLVVVVVSGV